MPSANIPVSIRSSSGASNPNSIAAVARVARSPGKWRNCNGKRHMSLAHSISGVEAAPKNLSLILLQ